MTAAEKANAYRNAIDDALAINGCLGVLSMMVMHATHDAHHGVALLASNEEMPHSIGEGTLKDAEKLLRSVREQMDSIVQNLGDYFNAHDSCSKTMIDLSGPVYAIMKKRADGVTLDD